MKRFLIIGAILTVFASNVEVFAKPLKVYILAGQSNMQGHARTDTIEHLAMSSDTESMYRALRDEEGGDRVVKDVYIDYLSKNGERRGQLTTGFGADAGKLGPELTCGVYLHKHLQEPILIIKTAWGGKSLNTDFRPPSAGPYVFNESQIERFKAKDKDVKAEAEKKQTATGHYYRLMVNHVNKVLGDISQVYPDYRSSEGYELAGFVWFQGWNDLVDSGTYLNRDKPGGYDAYSKVLGHFIRDVRNEFSVPKMPFVIGVLGVNGPVKDYTSQQQRHAKTHQYFRDAMAAPAALPEFKDNVKAVLTENYWDQQLTDLQERDRQLKQTIKALKKTEDIGRKEEAEKLEAMRSQEFTALELEILNKGISNQAYHYLGSAKILGQIGKGFADALIELSN